MRKKYLSLIFSVLFLISGIVFLCLYAMNCISDFVPLSMGSSLLEFLPVFFALSISSFAAFVLMTVLFFAESRIIFGKSVYYGAFAVILAAFIIINSVNAAGIINTYSDDSYYYDEDLKNEFPETYDEGRHVEAVSRYFPYFDTMTDAADGIQPYYSYTDYSFDGTAYIATQIFSQPAYEGDIYDENVNDITFTAEYFTSDKTYLTGKFIGEQSVLFATDENAEPLPESAVRQKTENGRDFLIYSSNTYKIFCLSGESECFSVWLQDSNNYLGIDEQEFIDYCFEQYEILKSDAAAQNAALNKNV